MKNKSKRGISPRNPEFRGEISRRNTAKKVNLSLRIKINGPVFRGVSRRKRFFLFKFNFNLDGFILFQVVSILCFRFKFV